MTDPDMPTKNKDDEKDIVTRIEDKLNRISTMVSELIEENNYLRYQNRQMRRFIDNFRDGGFYEG